VGDPRRRGLLLVGVAVVVLGLTAARGPVVLAAAGAVVLAVAAYRVAEVIRPTRSDWRSTADVAVDYEGRLDALATLLDPDGRDPDSPARLQSWFRQVASGRAPRRAGEAPGGTPTTPLADYLDGPPRRLTVADVDRLLTDLDRP
jgi:hypothetical protein